MAIGLKWNKRKKLQLIYLLVDILSSVLVWGAFLIFRWLMYENRIFSVDTVFVPMFNFYLPLFLYPIGCLLVYYLSGYYLRPLRKRYSKELSRTFVSAVIISLGAFFLIIINDPVADYQRYVTSLVVLLGLQFIGSYLPRVFVTYLSHRMEGALPRVYTIHSLSEVEEFEQLHAEMPYDEVILDLDEESK